MERNRLEEVMVGLRKVRASAPAVHLMYIDKAAALLRELAAENERLRREVADAPEWVTETANSIT